MTITRLHQTHTLSADQIRGVHRLLDDATSVDGVSPVDESGRLGLRRAQPARTHLLVIDDHAAAHSHRSQDPALLGYAHRTHEGGEEANGELVVHPEHRRRGIGRELVTALVNADPSVPLRLWAHGGHPGAAALADAFGLTKVRELWRMRAHVPDPVTPIDPGAPVRIRTFVPGVDEAAWLELNAAAFADHPEQGLWTHADLANRLAEPWFDPDGFFLAERAGDLVGFHWTKVHPDTPNGHRPIGEIYILGIHPDAHGHGLAKALASVGLGHLQDRGVEDVLLFVEADNLAAVRLYQRFGFTHTDTDVMYRHSGTPAVG